MTAGAPTEPASAPGTRPTGQATIGGCAAGAITIAGGEAEMIAEPAPEAGPESEPVAAPERDRTAEGAPEPGPEGAPDPEDWLGCAVLPVKLVASVSLLPTDSGELLGKGAPADPDVAAAAAAAAAAPPPAVTSAVPALLNVPAS